MRALVPTPPNATRTAVPGRPSHPALALTGLALSMLLSSLGVSGANVALPALGQVFDASLQQVQWVVLAYLLAVTTLIVSVGRLGDLLGRRRLLVAGLLLFTGASIACGAAPSLAWLIAARAAQGLGAAVMMALTMAFVSDTVPAARTGSAMGLLGTMSALGTALGPSLGGFLISGFGWPAIFLINAPLGIVAVALSARYLPAERREPEVARPRFDHRGTVLLAGSLGVYALALTPDHGFGLVNAVLFAAAVAGVALFVRVESSVASPLVRLDLFRSAALRSGFITSALVTTVVMATLVVGPFYLTDALGLDPGRVGLVMAAGPIVAALTGIPAGRFVDLFGSRAVTLTGLGGMVAGSAALTLVPTRAGVPGYVVPLIVITAGYALFQAANNTAVMTAIPASQRGVVSGLLNLSRNLGLITGASLMGAVYAVASDRSGAAFGMRLTFAVAAVLVGIGLAVAAYGRKEEAGTRSRPTAERPGCERELHFRTAWSSSPPATSRCGPHRVTGNMPRNGSDRCAPTHRRD